MTAALVLSCLFSGGGKGSRVAAPIVLWLATAGMVTGVFGFVPVAGMALILGVDRFLDSLAGYHADRRLIAVVFGLSLAFQMIAITTIFCISRALHWDASFVYFCIFVPLITLGEALPISIFGIGVRDGLYVFFFAQAGAGREPALALALVYVLITIVYSLLGGVLFLLRRPAARV